jgi:hypothetical protein
MQLNRQSGVILSLPLAAGTRAHAAPGRADFKTGRFPNLAFMAVILALAALWLVFPPAQLPGSPASQVSLAQDLPARNVLR